MIHTLRNAIHNYIRLYSISILFVCLSRIMTHGRIIVCWPVAWSRVRKSMKISMNPMKRKSICLFTTSYHHSWTDASCSPNNRNLLYQSRWVRSFVDSIFGTTEHFIRLAWYDSNNICHCLVRCNTSIIVFQQNIKSYAALLIVWFLRSQVSMMLPWETQIMLHGKIAKILTSKLYVKV